MPDPTAWPVLDCRITRRQRHLRQSEYYCQASTATSKTRGCDGRKVFCCYVSDARHICQGTCYQVSKQTRVASMHTLFPSRPKTVAAAKCRKALAPLAAVCDDGAGLRRSRQCNAASCTCQCLSFIFELRAIVSGPIFLPGDACVRVGALFRSWAHRTPVQCSRASGF